ncbi:MAG TPA: type II toxin-antitoxin system VapC family toxin, partial [Acidimicrobiales bacterium]|nr:type II toxin-antitoxin system VapC family toxin [Acidimicrobiales bacterium]
MTLAGSAASISRADLVVDTSALVAIVRHEAASDWLVEQLDAGDDRVMAAPTFVELGMVLESRAPASVGIARRAIRDAAIEIVPFDDDLADRAMEGWRRFGKGRHPAALNFGDCHTYALADKLGLPILCTGDD